MRATMTGTCTNADCANHDRKISLDSDPVDSMYESCVNCNRPLAIDILHAGHQFTSPEAFGQYLLGLVKELVGIKKLIDRGVVEPAERERYDELVDLLRDVKCTCCLQPFVDGNGVPNALRSK